MGDDIDPEEPLPTSPEAIDHLLSFGSPSTRRRFLKQIAGTSAALTVGARFTSLARGAPVRDTAAAASTSTSAMVPLRLKINGKDIALDIDTRTTVLDLLREQLNLTGSKKGCDHGQCGACTVLINGRRVNSCLSLAIVHDGAEVTTIEGLAQGEQLHPVQAAFIENDGFQCGYCTPGQICSAVACIEEGHAGSEGEIREWMSGNLCRCGAYPNIVHAIQQASGQPLTGVKA